VNQAVRVATANTPPSPPFPLDPAESTRLFGAALDALPPPEQHFLLFFDFAQETLNPTSIAQIPAILRAIQEKRSTNISIIGHTDTMGTPTMNQALGMSRARTVADLLRAEGVPDSSLFVTSHGEADLLVKTGRLVREQQNRRVEVIVR